jgi:hypothetical protein
MIGRNINDIGAKRLICAVLEQAISDVRGLIELGRISDGQIVIKAPKLKFCSGYSDIPEIKRLLEFFTKGRIDEWLELSGIDIDASQIRKRLGLRLDL